MAMRKMLDDSLDEINYEDSSFKIIKHGESYAVEETTSNGAKLIYTGFPDEARAAKFIDAQTNY